MKTIQRLLLAAMLLISTTVSAQYTQNNPKVEYMLKVEAGYLHFMGNYGSPKNDNMMSNGNDKGCGYYLNAWEEGMGLNVINGINISQDFFLGFGVGGNLCAPLRPAHFDRSSIMAQGFFDMDFRPVGDTWAPMIGLRLGYSMLINSNNYGTTMSPYLEVVGGLNWFYDHALQQMNRNYHSLYLETGILFVQQTVFVPIRIGWRL